MLQNGTEPSSKPKQKPKPAYKSHQLNPPSGIAEENINSYGSKPIQQQEEKTADTAEENAPAYGSDIAENVARMASGGNREAWMDNAAEQKANAAAEPANTSNNDDVAQNIAAGQKAIADVMKNHKEVTNAMYRPEVGGIDFVYGEVGTDAKKHKDGYGIAKIQYKHGDKAVQMIPEVIAKGKYEPSKYDDRAYFLHNGYRAVVRFTWDGNKKTWLVTNFLDKK